MNFPRAPIRKRFTLIYVGKEYEFAKGCPRR